MLGTSPPQALLSSLVSGAPSNLFNFNKSLTGKRKEEKREKKTLDPIMLLLVTWLVIAAERKLFRAIMICCLKKKKTTTSRRVSEVIQALDGILPSKSFASDGGEAGS